MFDSSLCHRVIKKVPVFIPWWQIQGIQKPLLITLIVLVIVVLFWLIRKARWRRWGKNPKLLLLLFGLTATLPLLFFVATKLLVVALPSDPGTKADAIVVLGRGGGEFYERRVNLAANLWKAGRSPLIFVSGITDAPSLMEQLEAKGIPRRSLDGENCSLTTAENAIFSAAILQPQGVRRILLVTDEPHMLRSMLVFRAHGFTVIPRTTPLPSYMSLKEKAFFTFREYSGLISYGLRGLFFQQNSSESSNPDILELIEKAREYGKQRSLK